MLPWYLKKIQPSPSSGCVFISWFRVLKGERRRLSYRVNLFQTRPAAWVPTLGYLFTYFRDRISNAHKNQARIWPSHDTHQSPATSCKAGNPSLYPVIKMPAKHQTHVSLFNRWVRNRTYRIYYEFHKRALQSNINICVIGINLRLQLQRRSLREGYFSDLMTCSYF